MNNISNQHFLRNDQPVQNNETSRPSTSMYVRDLEGEEYPIQVTSIVDKDLNGNQVLTATIHSNKVNDLFINDLTEMWEIADHDETEYKIIYAKQKGKGNRLKVDIKAITLFQDKLNTTRVYEVYDEHMTAHEYFSIVFAGTGYNFILVSVFEAIQWQGVGKGEAKLKLFKDGLDRYEAEFRIVGNTVYLEALIGRDTDFQYRHKLNASNIVKEIDATNMWTYAKGFGDYAEGEEEKAKLVREYTSPLAQIPGIGERHAPPIYDGRVTNAETMDTSLKTLVDESVKISVSADIHDLRKQGYELAQPELGDRVFLIDERINFDAEVRVINLSVTKDWQGKIIDLKLTFGSPSLTKRHQASLKTAVNRITELLDGKRQLPMSALANAVQVATQALLNAQTELQFPKDGGILAVDKNDPNLLVLFNSAGIGVSNDGGETFPNAITGNGIVAEAIIAGTLKGMVIEGSIINGGEFNTIGDTEKEINIFDGTILSSGSTYNSGYVLAELSSGRLRLTEESLFNQGKYLVSNVSAGGFNFYGKDSLGGTEYLLGALYIIQDGPANTWKTRLEVNELITDTGTY